MIAQLLVNGIVNGCIYALTALGFVLIYNTTRTFHFAHGAIYTFSAYLFYTLGSLWKGPLWVQLVVTLILTVLLGVAIDEVVYQPLVRRGSSPLIRLLSSLGAYIIIVNLIIMIYGNEVMVLNWEVHPAYTFASILLPRVQILMTVCSVLIFAALALALRLTRLGSLIRAMRDDPDLVSTLGVNPRGMRRCVFALGSALAGAAAIGRGLDVGVDPNAGMPAFLAGAVAVIVGGVRNFGGAVLGALLLGVFQSIAIWQFSGQWQDTVTFGLLILFLLLRPEGILGRRRRAEEVAA